MQVNSPFIFFEIKSYQSKNFADLMHAKSYEEIINFCHIYVYVGGGNCSAGGCGLSL